MSTHPKHTMSKSVKSEAAPLYSVPTATEIATYTDEEMTSIAAAERAYTRIARMRADLTALASPKLVASILKARLVTLEHEVFSVMFLDNRHRLIAVEDMFRGTIEGASVHPREVCKRALQLNAAAVILAHNHPSGVAEPSAADRAITTTLKDALNLLSIRTLDHFVIGDGEPTSFAERGWI